MRKILSSLTVTLLLSGSAMAMGTAESLAQLELYLLGRKFEQLPRERRVSQLERQMQQQPPGNVSLDYRINRLLATAGMQISQEAQTQAIQAYNRGVELSAAGRPNEAALSYRQALQFNPRLIEAYNNLGNILEQGEQYPEALKIYDLALYYSPRNAILHKNKGVLLQRMGQIAPAMQAYRKYLDHLPEGESDPAITEMLREYEKTRSLADHQPDYFGVVTSSSEGRLLNWPGFLNPVPVFVEMENTAQFAFLSLVREGLSTWEHASEGRLRFSEVADPGKARIHILLSDGPLTHPYLNVGHARYYSDDDRNVFKSLRVVIRINTGNSSQPAEQPARLAQIRRLVLHELGHAIGIWGHSNNPNDIMYTHPIASGLSERDVRTARRLYDQTTADEKRSRIGLWPWR